MKKKNREKKGRKTFYFPRLHCNPVSHVIPLSLSRNEEAIIGGKKWNDINIYFISSKIPRVYSILWARCLLGLYPSAFR